MGFGREGVTIGLIPQVGDCLVTVKALLLNAQVIFKTEVLI